ncbi:MAG: glycosyltransferase [Pseudomonadota bacterium]
MSERLNMKVLMVTRESGIDNRYGLGKSLLPIISEMQTLGIPVIYLTQADAGQRSIQVCKKIHHFISTTILAVLRKRQLTDLLWGIIERVNMGRLAALVCKREQISHVHCHDPIIAFGFKWFKRILFVKQQIKWGVTEHGFGSYIQAIHEDGCVLSSRTMRYLRTKEASILLQADWLITPTNAALQQLSRDLSVYPVPEHWFAIVHPAPIIKPLSYSKSRELLNWKENTFYILAVGRLVPLKQFPLLLQACSQLKQKDFYIVILGDGNAEQLYQQALQLGLENRLLITSTDDIGSYYAAADLYVSCSATESFGYANLEALSLGLPVISTAVGGCAEVVASGGWLVPVDKQALSNAIHTVMTDFSLRMDLSNRAIQWTRNWPTIKQVSNAYLNIYQSQQLMEEDNFQLGLQNNSPGFPINNPRLFECLSTKIKQLPIFPVAEPLSLPENANIVVVIPHPDDETIWCGATLAKLSAQSCNISAILFTDGESGDPENYFYGQSIAELRYQEFQDASSLYGLANVLRLQQEDGNYYPDRKIKAKILNWLEREQPDWILTPHLMDAHRDHILVSLTMYELWPQLKKRPRLFFYDGWWPSQVNSYVDISDKIEAKKQALSVYKTPLKYVDYLKLSEYLSQYRGVSLAASDFAEGFFEITEKNYNDILKSMTNLRMNL